MPAVVVASKDRRELLLQTLPRHLAEASQVVLVDDGSTDGTAEAVRAALPEVRVVRLDASRGAAARNAGLRAVDDDLVALADDDAWWAPGALARAAEAFAADPRLALVQARVLVGEEGREDPVMAEMAASPLTPAPGQPGHAILGFVACGAVVRRRAVLQAGGFSSLFGIGGEEELLSLDLASAGWHLSYLPDVVAHHHPPAGGGDRPERRAREVRNLLWSTWLRRPAGPAARRTLRTLGHAVGDPVAARGVLDAVAGAGPVLRRRRVLAPHVEAQRALLER